MRHVPGWQPWESYVNEQLGLDPTVASGNQFYDKGDGVDRSQGEWAFQVDSKYTDKISFSTKAREMTQWATQAMSRGKQFVLAVRCWPRGYHQPVDFAVVPFDTFSSMLSRLKELELAQRDG